VSARHCGALWSDRPRDWALSEQQQAPVYEQTLRRVGLERGERVLDLGCGAGVFLRLCADRGARVAGIDASEGLLALAHRRRPNGSYGVFNWWRTVIARVWGRTALVALAGLSILAGRLSRGARGAAGAVRRA
jgi:SAM-dependent methyltransferase